jgi:hypothetical protein
MVIIIFNKSCFFNHYSEFGVKLQTFFLTGRWKRSEERMKITVGGMKTNILVFSDDIWNCQTVQ